MSKLNFSTAWRKLERGKKHIVELEKSVDEYVKQDGVCFLNFETVGQSSEVRLKLDFKPPSYDEFGTMLGDAIGNIRSALDYLAVTTIEAVTGKSKEIYFPFAPNKDEYEKSIRKQSLDKCGASMLRFLVRDVQTYEKGRCNALWALNRLRNADKHRFLLTTLAINTVTVSYRDAKGELQGPNTFGTIPGAPFIPLVISNGPAELVGHQSVSAELCLNEEDVPKGLTVSQFFAATVSQTEYILHGFERILR